ncbi:MAG TPA: YggS family pyridoxal phosphate-dependent enzyme [Actinobacteria bacterium]|jgi:pyridoxal phosphate enzyme (YggS family)|nr:YggS family pyridoxal phosphate-dependent enzyme [Actinomycetota bacterium]
MNETDKIKNNLEKIKLNIENTCRRTGRDANSVKLLIVSKYAEVDQIKYLHSLGLREFGENRAENLIMKSEEMKNDVIWHFIGHLQTNKIKKVVPIADLIHSIDSIKTIAAIDSYCKNINKVQKVLVEINLSGENTKYGLMINDVNNFFKDALKYNNVEIKGLMTMAPFTDDSETVRKVFKNLRLIKEELEAKDSFLNLKELSMGMSNDYITAIEEGSTIIRIGSAVFK